MRTAGQWIDDVKSRGVLALASELGLEPKQRGSVAHFGCPSCKAATRHTRSRDRRGAVGVRRDGLGWRCYQCEASGTAFDLVCFARCGATWRDLSQSQRDEVRAWCDSPAVLGLEFTPPPELPYPDVREVMTLLRQCIPVTKDAEASAWLRSEHIDPALAHASGLCGVLPLNADLPRWARYWRKPWLLNRLLFPMIDVDGNVRSVTANRMRERHEYKSLPPYDRRRAGLAFACRPLRLHLRGQVASSATHLCFVEGEKKHALRALTGDGALVVGVETGALTREFMEKMPKSLERISILTDADTGGARHATDIYAVMTQAQRQLDIEYTAGFEFGRLRNGTYGFSLLP